MVAQIGRTPDEPEHSLANQMIADNNPNCSMNDDGTLQWQKRPDGVTDWYYNLTGPASRWVPYNVSQLACILYSFQLQGGLGNEQLEWVAEEVEDSYQAGQKVIVLCHVPVCPGSCRDICLIWNYQELLTILHKHGNVVAYMAGHDHDGGYALDESGCHHITFRSPLEAQPPQGCHALIDVHSNVIAVHGYGTQESYVLPM